MDLRRVILLVAVISIAHAFNRFHRPAQSISSFADMTRNVAEVHKILSRYEITQERLNATAIHALISDFKTKMKYQIYEAFFNSSCSIKSKPSKGYTITPRPQDCQDLYESGYTDLFDVGITDDGVYKLYGHDWSKHVYCEGRGWTVIQKRSDDSLDYRRSHEEYAQGFGDVSGEHWLGLDTVHRLTAAGDWTLRIELKGYNGATTWAEYTGFSVGPGPDFTLHFDGYRGNAGDGLGGDVGGRGDQRYNLRGMKFSTYDNDQDGRSNRDCADIYGGGWWYNDCEFTTTTGTSGRRISWQAWKQYQPLEAATLKIKRTEPAPEPYPMFERPEDCGDLYGYRDFFHGSGVYTIYGDTWEENVFCENHGWTVIQKRTDDSVDYHRTHDEYSRGFGDVSGEHWLGLDAVHRLTANGDWILRVQLERFDGETAEVEYYGFSIGPGPDFVLYFDDYYGNAGNSLGGRYHDMPTIPYRTTHSNHYGKKFSTYDNDQNTDNVGGCMNWYGGGGWWYDNCVLATTTSMPYSSGIFWQTFNGYHSLKGVILKIKRI